MEVKEVQDPRIEKPDNIIAKITSTAICGSDLHLFVTRDDAESAEGFHHRA